MFYLNPHATFLLLCVALVAVVAVVSQLISAVENVRIVRHTSTDPRAAEKPTEG